MKVTILALWGLFIFQPLSFAEENWQSCMDHGDFSFNADSFLKSHRVSKSGCQMRFIEMGGKGTKFELNLCDPRIHIAQFDGIDATSSTKHYAGSTGCPAPLFGADFDLPKKGGVEFGQAKAKVLEVFQAIKKVFGPSAQAQDIGKIKQPSQVNSDAKMACAQLLLEEYLDRCVAFEPTPDTSRNTAPSNIPGVHPQTIPKDTLKVPAGKIQP